MLLNDEQTFLTGVHQQPIISQQERTDELNQRIRSRHTAYIPTDPMYSFRPVSTKYDVMATKSVPITQLGNRTWVNRMSNIDTESELRNQIYALQNASQAVYVPSSNSDLYHDGTTVVARPSAQPYPGLFESPTGFSQTRWSDKGNLPFNYSTSMKTRK
jgi:hypothetical protein